MEIKNGLRLHNAIRHLILIKEIYREFQAKYGELPGRDTIIKTHLLLAISKLELVLNEEVMTGDSDD